MRDVIVSLAKILWALAIVAALGVLSWRSRTEIVATLGTLPPWTFVASLVPLVLSKYLLGENAHLAAARYGIRISYSQALRLYNLSQLGKYIPGSIWQFVGRAAAYRTYFGATIGQIRDSLITENLWTALGAAVVGILFCGVPLWRFLSGEAPWALVWWLATLTGTGVLAIAALLLWRPSAPLRYIRSAAPTKRVALVQALIWLFLGLSFWSLARAGGVAVPIVYATGLFAGAFATGFLTPFAPAGLGVRDAVLVFGLLPYATQGQALAVAVAARLIYLASELLIVFTPDTVFSVLRKGRAASSDL